jgi:CubicO group peptidase (beta-lactamase class C family)
MPHLATFYESGFGEARQVATRVDYSCFAGAAGFVSTPSDLVRFGMAMSNGKLLKRETVHMLQSPQRLASGPETQYGLGWMLDTVPLAGEHVRLANHANRALVGGSGSFMTFPDVGLVVAVTTNIAWSSTRQMSLDIAQAFAEQARHPVAK